MDARMQVLSFDAATLQREEFVALGKLLGGVSGWVPLVFNPREGTLLNPRAADQSHTLAGDVLLLALNMYEHAVHIDHGAAAGANVDAFIANIDWAGVYARYLRGGIDGWRTPSRPLIGKQAG